MRVEIDAPRVFIGAYALSYYAQAIAVHVLVVSTCILQDGGGAAPRPDAPAGLKERCRPPQCLSRGSAELADTSRRREAF